MVARWKHIGESQRGTISRMLSHGSGLKEIAKALGMHPTALSREIRRNRSKTKPGDGECPKTRRFPFVCNGCPRRYERSCRFARYRYGPSGAQALADSRLRASRSGVDATHAEFAKVDEAVKEGVGAGRSIYAISRSEEVSGIASQSTLSAWIGKGLMTTKRIDLPRAVRFKKRSRKKYDYAKANAESKPGRSYVDLLRWRLRNPGAHGAQMDFLGAIASDRNEIFVLVFPEPHYAIGRMMPKAGSADVVAFFDQAESSLRPELFAKIFGFALTDNDPRFANAKGIEFSAETGERRTRLFYCDPYSSGQKGAVENMNGRLRRFFPKGKSIDGLAADLVANAFENVNSQPVKSLGGATPKSAFADVFGKEAEEAVSRSSSRDPGSRQPAISPGNVGTS